jgi:hypothetical protein
MGYGIKLLITQQAFLPKALHGGQDEWGFIQELKREADIVHKLQEDLFRLSCWTIGFISSCETLFKIYGDDDDENIYIWKHKYTEMEWDDLKAIIEPLLQTYLEEDADYKKCLEEAKIEIIDALQKLINVSYITNKFQIY